MLKLDKWLVAHLDLGHFFVYVFFFKLERCINRMKGKVKQVEVETGWLKAGELVEYGLEFTW